MKQTIRTAFWGFFWGYVVVFVLCMTLLLIGMGAAWPGLDGLLHIARDVFFSHAQYVFLGVGAVAAMFRAHNADRDRDLETENQERTESFAETIESLGEDWSE